MAILIGYDLCSKTQALGRKLSRLERAIQTDLSCGRTPVIRSGTNADLEAEYYAVKNVFETYRVRNHPDLENVESILRNLAQYIRFEKKS